MRFIIIKHTTIIKTMYSYLQTQFVYEPGYKSEASARNMVEWQTLANQRPNPATFEVQPPRCAQCDPTLKSRFLVPEHISWKSMLPAFYYQSLPRSQCPTVAPSMPLSR